MMISRKHSYYMLALFAMQFYMWGDSYASEIESEQGMITKIIGEYVAINLGAQNNISIGDTLWVYRRTNEKPRYVGLVGVIGKTGSNSGAKILYVRPNEIIKVLDMVSFKPENIDVTFDKEVNNLAFAEAFLKNQEEQSNEREMPVSSVGNGDRSRQMPSVILFTVGGVGVGMTAAFGALAMYHDYKAKYSDDVNQVNSHIVRYRDFRKARNIAGVSSAGILLIAVISHYVGDH